MITFHIEAVSNEDEQLRIIKLIQSFKVKAGVSIKPKTQVSSISQNVLNLVDMVLIMTVEPGFGG
jgi:ribulose-phosphate 3-epimerase